MIAVAIIWVGIGLILWVTYRVTHGAAPDDVHAPPQKTMLGAMMWPFYLANFLFQKGVLLLGLRSKTDDE